MIEELKDDEIISHVGGRFKLASLMMKRWIELMQNDRPMVDPGNMGELEVIAKEIMEEKIAGKSLEAGAPEQESSEGVEA